MPLFSVSNHLYSINDYKVCRELEKNDFIARLSNFQNHGIPAPQGNQPPVYGYSGFNAAGQPMMPQQPGGPQQQYMQQHPQ
jgi:hypothetical protein